MREEWKVLRQKTSGDYIWKYKEDMPNEKN